MATYEATPIPGSKCTLGEGTLWDERRQEFVWVDVFAKSVKTYCKGDGRLREFHFSKMTTYVGKRLTGGYVVALGDSIALTDDEFNLKTEIDLNIDLEVMRTNDGNIDPCGCLWIGSAEVIEGSATGELYKIDASYKKTIQRRNIHIANGVDWSPDGTSMYYIDSAPREISRYQYNPEKGEIVRELSAIDVSDVTGVPDGMCTDSLGNLWVAFWGCGQVRNYTPDGELLNIVQAPTALTTCPSFGGPEMKTMFITSAQDHYQPEFAFDSNNDKFGGMCFEVELPIAGKLDNFFLG